MLLSLKAVFFVIAYVLGIRELVMELVIQS